MTSLSIINTYQAQVTYSAFKERNQLLLEQFIQATAPKFGIREKISLFLVDQPCVFQCDTRFKIIYVSKDWVKNYGMNANDSPLDIILDLLPNDPEHLNAKLYNLTYKTMFIFKSIFTSRSSDIEIEALIMHEIGHIALDHKCYLHTAVAQRHHNEHTADMVAYITPRGRIGFSRFLKRKMVDLFLIAGPNIYRYLSNINAKESHPTHPSTELRLKLLGRFEGLIPKQ